ncbi:MAG: hypothetical protein U0U70_17640 [Chitinophagaceae bacterium]
MNKSASKLIRPVLFIFVFVTAFAITGKRWLEKEGISQEVVIVGNLILFAVSMAAWYINIRSFRSSNPQSSVRAMYGSFLIKFFVIALAAVIYIMMARKNVNKPALMICAGLYVLYAGIETSALMKMAKLKKDA